MSVHEFVANNEHKLIFNLNDPKFAYLKDHFIQNRVVISGATLLTSLAKLVDFHYFIEEIIFLKPISLTTDNNVVEVVVKSDHVSENFSIWCHGERICFGKISSIQQDCPKQKMADGERKLSHIENIDSTKFYTFMKNHGYNYGQAFQTVKSLKFEKNYGELIFTISNHFDAILDGMLQSMAYVLLNSYIDDMLVPFSIDKFFMQDSCDNLKSSCLVGKFEVDFKEKSGNFVITSVIDGEKKVVAAGEGVHFRSLPGKSKIAYFIPSLEEMSRNTKIGIRSIACRLPGGITNVQEFWDFIKSGKTADSKIPATRIPTRNDFLKKKYGTPLEGSNFITQDIYTFDAPFFGISKIEADAMDPQQRLLLEVVYECAENAGLTSLNQTGFFIGVMGSEYPESISETRKDALAMLGSASSIMSGRLNHIFDSHGPSMAIDTACSSSLVALDSAINAIKQGRCKRAIVAGVNLMLSENGLGQRVNGRMLSEDGVSRTFDASASGYGRADGCVAILIEPVQNRMDDDYYGVVEAVNVNHDGKSIALTAPNGKAHQLLIKKCLEDCQLDSSCLAFWECHGTGTRLGDPIELNALQKVLEDYSARQIYVNSIKASIGHTEAAAGLVGILSAVLQLKYRYLVPLARFSVNNPQIKLSSVAYPIVGMEFPKEIKEKALLTAGVSSFGVSGINACVVISSAPSSGPKSNQIQKLQLLPISAKNSTSLQNLTRIYQKFFNEDQDPVSSEQICIQAALFRKHFDLRAALVNDDRSKKFEVVTKKFSKNVDIIFDLKPGEITTIFNFYLDIPVYRSHMNKICQKFCFLGDRMWLGDKKMLEICGTYALFRTLMDFGVKPKFFSAENLIEQHLVMALEREISLDEFKNLVQNPPFTLDSKKNLTRIIKKQDLANDALVVTLQEEPVDPPQTIHLKDIATLNHFLGNLYVTGIDLNWKTIYLKNNSFRHNLVKVNLPNYYFDRKLHFLGRAKPTFDHPLIGSVVNKQDEEDLYIFENQLRFYRLPFLQDVEVEKQKILPFGCILEMLLASSKAVFEDFDSGKYGIEVEKIELGKMINLEDQAWVTTTIQKTTKNTIQTKISFSTSEEICRAKIKSVPRRLIEKLNFTPKIKGNDSNQSARKSHKLIQNDVVYKNFYQNFSIFDNNVKVPVIVVHGLTKKEQNFGNHWMSDPIILESIIQFLLYQDNDLSYQEAVQKIKKIQLFGIPISQKTMYLTVNKENEIALYNEDGEIHMVCETSIKLSQNLIPPSDTLLEEVEEIKVNKIDLSEKSTLEEITQKLQKALQEVLNPAVPIQEYQHEIGFVDLGLDSLSLINFMDDLNLKHFHGIGLSSTDLFSHSNVKQLAKLIYDKKNGQTEQVFKKTPTYENQEDMKNPKTPSEIQKQPHILPELQTHDFQEFEVRESARRPINVSESQEVLAYEVTPVKILQAMPDLLAEICAKEGLVIAVRTKNLVKISQKHTKNDTIWKSELQKALAFLTAKRSIRLHISYLQSTFSFDLQEMALFLMDFVKSLLHFDLSLQYNITTSYSEFHSSIGGFTQAFFKSLASEKPHRFGFQHTEHLVRHANLSKPKKLTILNGTWLITGGLSGIGIEMAKVLVKEYYVPKLVLVSRSGVKNPQIGAEIKNLKKFTQVDVFQADVSKYEEMENVFEEILSGLPTHHLEGIIHSAGCSYDALFENQTFETFDKVIRSKCTGLENILQLLAKYHIEPNYLIINSSISAIFGNSGQTNYASANAYVDGIIKSRRRLGLSGTTINWSNWLGTGMAEKGNVNEKLRKMGFLGISIEEGLRYFKWVIETKPIQVVVAKIDWKLLLKYRPDLEDILGLELDPTQNQERPAEKTSFRVQNWLENSEDSGIFTFSEETSVITENSSFVSQLDFLPKLDMIKEKVEETVKSLMNMSIEDEHGIEKSIGFMELGLDSYKLYQLSSELNNKFGSYLQEKENFTILNVVNIFEHPNIESLSKFIEKRLKKYYLSSSRQKDPLMHNAKQHPSKTSESFSLAHKSGQAEETGLEHIQNFSVFDKATLSEEEKSIKPQLIENSDENAIPYAITVSGKTQIECEQKISLYTQLIETHGVALSLQEIFKIATEASQSTVAKPYRGYLMFKKNQILCTKIEKSFTNHKISFMLSGQGSQYSKMGMVIYEQFVYFRSKFNFCLERFDRFLKLEKKLLDVYLTQEVGNWPSVAIQPLLFSFCYALGILWQKLGIEPNFCVGHSVGEIVGAVFAEALSLENAIELVSLRAKAFEKLSGRGKMVATDPRILKFLDLDEINLSISAHNGPKQVVLAGSHDALENLSKIANKQGFSIKVINENYPFHSNIIQDEDLDELKNFDRKKFHKPKKHFLVSNVTGEFLENYTLGYIQAHAKSTVQFTRCIKTLLNHEANIFIEIGPGKVLSNITKKIIDHDQDKEIKILNSNDPKKKEVELLLESLLEVYLAGCNVDIKKFYEELESEESGAAQEEVIQKVDVSFEDFLAIKDHQFYDKIIVPAAFQIEAFCCAATSHENVNLQNVEFRKEILPEDLTNLVTHSNNIFLSLKHKEIEFSRCLIDKEVIENVENLTCQDEVLQNFNPQDFYTGIQKCGINYGERLQLVTNIKRSRNYIEAELIQLENQPKWCLYDAALQALGVILYDKNQTVFYVPVKMRRFYRTNMKLKGLNLYVKGKILKRSESTAEGTVAIFTSLGKEWCRMENVVAVNKIQYTNRATPEFELVPGTAINIPSHTNSDVQKPIIAIRGYAGRFHGPINDPSNLWDYLKTGSCASESTARNFSQHTLLSNSNPSEFDPQFFNITPKEAKFIDPQQRWLLEEVHHAMEDANLKKFPKNTGVFIGASGNDFAQKIHANFREKEDLSGYLTTGTNTSVLAGRIAHFLKIEGPTMAFDTGCSSFAVAISVACDHLSSGKCQMAIVGAVNVILNNSTTIALQNAGMLSPNNRCATFDEAADGYVRAEAAAIVILEALPCNTSLRYEHIQISGWSIRHNGNSIALTAPNSMAQIETMKEAIYENENMIDLYESHGSGTKLGDPIEIKSIAEICQNQDSGIVSAVKTHLGHCEAASGAASLIFVLETMKNSYIPAIKHFKFLNPKIDWAENLVLPIIGMEKEVNLAVINSFGFSGTNSSILLKNCKHLKTSPKVQEDEAKSEPCHLLVLSAKSVTSLEAMIKNMQIFLNETAESLENIGTILQKGRNHYPYRYAQIITDGEEVRLDYRKSGLKSTKDVIFVFGTIPYANFVLAKLIQDHMGFRKFWHKIKFLLSPKISTNEKKCEIFLNLALLLFFDSCNVPIEFAMFSNGLEYASIGKNFLETNRKLFKSSRITVTDDIITKNEETRILDMGQLFKCSSTRPCQTLNQLIADLYMAQFDISFDVFNPRTLAYQVKIPEYVFSKKRYWPFDEGLNKSTKANNQTMLYETIFEERSIENSTENSLRPKQKYLIFKQENAQVDVTQLMDFTDLPIFPLSDTKVVLERFQVECSKTDLNLIILLEPNSEELSQISQFLALKDLILAAILFKTIHFTIITSQDSNFGLVAFLRTVASEYQHFKYKLIETDFAAPQNLQLLLNELSMKPPFECNNIQIKNGKSFVEKLQICELLYSPSRPQISYSKILIIGGTGGIGRKMAEFFQNSDEIILASRNPTFNPNRKIKTYKCAIEDLATLEAIFQSEPGIRLIIHCAGVVENALLLKQNKEKFEKIFQAKVEGTKNLIYLAKRYGVKKMVAMSSMAAVLGSSGQANYATSNSIMTSLCLSAQNDHLKTLVISWGPWKEIGMLTKKDPGMDVIRNQIQKKGWNLMAFKQTISLFSKIWNLEGHICVFDGDWELIQSNEPHLRGLLSKISMKKNIKRIKMRRNAIDLGRPPSIPFDGIKLEKEEYELGVKEVDKNEYSMQQNLHISSIVEQNLHISPIVEQNSLLVEPKTQQDDDQLSKQEEFTQEIHVLNTTTKNLQEQQVIATLTNIIKDTSGLENIHQETGLMSIGIDSLMLEQIRIQIERKFLVQLAPSDMYIYSTFNSLVGYIQCNLPQEVDKIAQNGKLRDQNLHNNQNFTIFKNYDEADMKENGGELLEDSSYLNQGNKFFAKNDIRPASTTCLKQTFKNIKQDDIAIIGFSGAFSGCESPEEFWKHLLSGKECLTTIPNSEISLDVPILSENSEQKLYIPTSGVIPNTDQFDYNFFKLSQSDAEKMDPQIRLFLKHAYIAFEHAGYVKERGNLKVGCFVGAEPSSYGLYQDNPEDHNQGSLLKNYEMNQKDFCATWTSHLFNLCGPSVSVYSACSTSLVAIREAMDALIMGRADICIAGGVNLVLPEDIGHHYQPGMVLASEGHCRPFDMNATGIIRGSSVGAVILKKAHEAIQNHDFIHAIILSCAVNNDGSSKSNFMAPGFQGQVNVMKDSLSNSNTPREDIHYIECHATGTSVGDAMEIKAIKEVFGGYQKLGLGSIKANIGHSFAGAGMASLIKCIYMLKENLIPPQINVNEFNSELKDTNVKINVGPEKLTEKPEDDVKIGINSFGIGGTNASAILSRFVPEKEEVEDQHSATGIFQKAYILPISAASPNSCVRYCRKLAEYFIENGKDSNLHKISNTLQHHREIFPYRTAIVATSASEAAEKLAKISLDDILNSNKHLTNENLAFFFAPQGVQYAKMLHTDLKNCPLLDEKIRELCQYATQLCGVDFLQILQDPEIIQQVEYSQLAIFIITYAISWFLQKLNIEAKVCIGHSVGEYAALAYSKAISPKECIKFLVERSKLIGRTASAKMVTLKKYEGMKLPDGVEISARLSDEILVATGSSEVVEEFIKNLNHEKVEHRVLKTTHGFHSYMLDPILEDFRVLCNKTPFNLPQKDIISSVNGQVLTSTTLKNPSTYLTKHLRQPVRIDLALQSLHQNYPEIQTIIEIGPRGMLTNLLKAKNGQIKVVNTLLSRTEAEKNPTRISLLEALATLWCHGYEIDFMQIFGKGQSCEPNLPLYQFDEVKCWQSLKEKKNRDMQKFRIYEKIWKFHSISSQNLNSISSQKPNLLIFSSLGIKFQDLAKNFNMIYVNLGSQTFEKVDPNNFNISKNEADYEKLKKSLGEVAFSPQIIVHILPEECENALQKTFYTMFYIKKYLASGTNSMSIFAIELKIFEETQNFEAKENRKKQGRQNLELKNSYSKTVIGPMNEILNLNPNAKCFYIKLDDEVQNLHDVITNFSSKNTRLSYIQQFWLKNQVLMELDYHEVEVNRNDVSKENEDQEEKICIIFGGLSMVGQAYMQILVKQYAKIRFILASRTAKVKAKQVETQKKSTTHEFHNINIDNLEEIESLLKKFPKINFIIHAAGIAPITTLSKTPQEIEIVFQAKIFGTVNILKALQNLNVYVEKLFLVSSLTGILGLTGAEDYASANLFMDGVAESGHPNVKEILCLQWPGWKESKMLKEAQDSEEMKEIWKNAISFREGCEIIQKALTLKGSYAIANTNPLTIATHMKSFTQSTHPQKIPQLSTIPDKKELLRKLWSESLTSLAIQDTDDFFKLGGNSLNGVQLTWKINETFRINSTINLLFDQPIFEDFYNEIMKFDADEQDSWMKIPRITNVEKIPLSYPQENMFLLKQIDDGTHYNIMFEIELEGEKFCQKSSRMALLRLIEKQDSLRTRFLKDEQGNPYQEVLPLNETDYNLDWKVITSIEAQDLIESEKNYNFSLEEPPFKIITYKLNKKFYIIVSHHHIITDGWSMTIFAREFTNLYKSFLEKDYDSTPSNPISYADFAAWNKNRLSEEKILKLAKKLEKLENFGTTLASDFARPLVKTYNGASLAFDIPKKLGSDIKEHASKLHVTEYVLLLTGFARVLNRWRQDSEAENVVFGCPVAGRNHPQVENIIGYFLNNIILQIPTEALNQPSKLQLIESIKKSVNEALEFQEVPFHTLVSKLQKHRTANMHPLFQIYFNYRHSLDFPKVDIPGVATNVNQLTMNRVFEFSCTIDEMEEGKLRILFEYDPEIFEKDTIRSYGRDYLKELRRLTQETEPKKVSAHMKICEFPMTPIQNILINQAKSTPENIAIGRLKHNCMTYIDLEKIVIILSRKLTLSYFLMMGEILKSDDVIPIVMERNDAILWIFSVIAAGACYTPIDPSFPENRIKTILEQLDLGYAISTIDIDGIKNLNLLQSGTTTQEAIPFSCYSFNKTANYNLAYILFTSGSTGIPKGVCIEHQNLLSFLTPATQQLFCHSNIAIPHSVNTIFDVSLMNMFTPLINGGQLLYSLGTDHLLEEQVQTCTHLFLTSAVFNCFGKRELEKLKNMEMLMVGGETPASENIKICIENGVKFMQIYGPTETTIWSMTNMCRRGFENGSVLGDIMPNESIELVAIDGSYNTTSLAIGELYISGFGVARGYLKNNLSGSTSKFLHNTNLTLEDQILERNTKVFKTGDLFRRAPNEKFKFIGRADAQLKINGIRIDQQEISLHIKQIDSSITDVLVTTNILENRTLLVAFLITSQQVDDKQLRESLLKNIPSYMIPSIFIPVSKLPINLSGKVDKQKLHELYEIFIKGQKFPEIEKFTSDMEQKLAKIWQDLGVFSKISKSSDFFISGGNSLAIFQLRQKILEVFYLDFSIDQLYQHTIFQDQVTLIQGRLSQVVNKEEDLEVIICLRQSPNAVSNVYCIHAIGGTIYPYYAFVHMIPEKFNLHAIGYSQEYLVGDLKSLAKLYATHILKHTNKLPYVLLGHSLGGILAREIAIEINSRKILVHKVIMLDSWAVGNENLDLEAIREYINDQFRHMPDSENLVEAAMKLADMLKNHRFSYHSGLDITLIKARDMTNTPIRNAIRSNLTLEVMRYYEDNGWGQFCDYVEVWLANGDHDSILKLENLSLYANFMCELLNSFI